MPLFKGKINKNRLTQALYTDEPLNNLMNDKDLQLTSGISLIFRLHDNQLQLRPRNQDYSDLDSSLVSGKKGEQFAFDRRQVATSKQTVDSMLKVD